MHGFFILICIFSDLFASIVSFLIGFDHSLFLRICCIFTFVYSLYMAFYTRNEFASKTTNKVFIISFLLVIFIFLTMLAKKQYLDITSDTYRGMILSFGSKCMVAPFLAIAWNKRNFINSVLNWIIPFTVMSSLGSCLAVSQLGGKSFLYIELGRQLMSYGGAFSIGLLLFYIRHGKNNFFGLSGKIISITLICINVFIIISGGGKGAFVLACFIFLMFFYEQLKKKILFLVILFTILFILGNSLIVNFISQVEGGNRILTMFFSNNIDDITSGRNFIYSKALDLVLDRCFLGTGAGSVVYDLGYYSHNVFLDILIDWGFIGIALYLGIVFIVCRKSFIFQKDKNISFLFIIFITQFTLLMFSSSFYVNFGIWFSSIAILGWNKIPTYSKT